jgi:8-oxo-dGTP diphosphatase
MEQIMKQHYVVGFAFNPEKNKVLLIKKNRPNWQAGKFNGIGGKIESFDSSPFIAMSREFKEETGLEISPKEWDLFNIIESPDFKLFVFHTTSTTLDDFQSITDEIVHYVEVSDLFNNQFSECISNLSWLISMCLDRDIDRISGQITYQNF